MNDSTPFGPSMLVRRLGAALRDIEASKAAVRHAAARDLAQYVDGPDGSRVIDRLTRVIQTDSNTEVRVAAMLALVDGGAKNSLGVILDAARAGEPRLRQMALLALAELAIPGAPEAIQVALDAVRSELPALRYQGLVALRSLQQLAALDTIAECARDEDAEVRWVVSRLLDELWALRGAAADDDIEPGGVRRIISEALMPLLRDSVDRVRVAAILALARMGVVEAIDAIPSLLSRQGPKLDREDEQVAIEVSGEFGIVASMAALQRRAWPLFWESALAWKARVALAQLGDERACAAVMQDLRSKSPHKCARAIEAAGRIRLETARPLLLALVENPNGHDVRAIKTALERLGCHE